MKARDEAAHEKVRRSGLYDDDPARLALLSLADDPVTHGSLESEN
jgi:hypothetical protein